MSDKSSIKNYQTSGAFPAELVQTKCECVN